MIDYNFIAEIAINTSIVGLTQKLRLFLDLSNRQDAKSAFAERLVRLRSPTGEEKDS